MKREIEIKAKVDDLEEIASFLQKKGSVLGKSLHQVDTIYFPKGSSPIKKQLSDPVLRIRRVDDAAIFTYKHSNSQDLDKTEYETGIDNPESLHEVLLILGFDPIIVVEKRRIQTSYKGFTLCLDSVKNLGEFIEIERIADEDANQVQEEMKKIFKELGVKDENIVLESYDKTLWRRLHESESLK